MLLSVWIYSMPMLLKYWLDTTNFALTSNSQHYRHNQRPKEQWENKNQKKKKIPNKLYNTSSVYAASRYFLPYYTLKFKSASHCLCAAFAIYVQLMRTSLFLFLSYSLIRCLYPSIANTKCTLFFFVVSLIQTLLLSTSPFMIFPFLVRFFSSLLRFSFNGR